MKDRDNIISGLQTAFLQDAIIKETAKSIINARLPYKIKRLINGDFSKLSIDQIKQYGISIYLEDLGFSSLN